METMTPFSLASTPKIPSYSLPLPQARTVTTFSGRGCSVRSSSALTGVRRKGRNTTQLNCSRKSLSPTLIKCGGTVREIKENEFSDVVLKSELPVLVEFVATWCGPCRLIAPAVKSLAEEYEDKLMIVKVDHDANPQLIEEYKVYGLPALILFQNGKEVPHSRREGAITKTKLKEYLDKLLESVSTF